MLSDAETMSQISPWGLWTIHVILSIFRLFHLFLFLSYEFMNMYSVLIGCSLHLRDDKSVTAYLSIYLSLYLSIYLMNGVCISPSQTIRSISTVDMQSETKTIFVTKWYTAIQSWFVMFQKILYFYDKRLTKMNQVFPWYLFRAPQKTVTVTATQTAANAASDVADNFWQIFMDDTFLGAPTLPNIIC